MSHSYPTQPFVAAERREEGGGVERTNNPVKEHCTIFLSFLTLASFAKLFPPQFEDIMSLVILEYADLCSDKDLSQEILQAFGANR